MKIVHIIPGSGGTFYCQNCMRDKDLVKSLMTLGHEIHMVPMYLPLGNGDNNRSDDTPIFYGAINMYIKEKIPLFRFAPKLLTNMFDSRPFLRFAAKKSGSTRASGLEEMTISMLMGEEGRQASELDHLVTYLAHEIKPDIIHLSNALLLGLAHRLKNDLNAKIVCSLQDENEWIDLMDDEYQVKVWALMAEKAVDVDMFVAASNYYCERSRNLLGISFEKTSVVYNGINPQDYELSSLPSAPPVIGYLCRMSEYFGLGILIDAFIHLKKDGRFPDLQLHLTGGHSGDDTDFIKKMLQKVSGQGYENDVQIFDHFDKKDRIQFLKSLTLLSVPVPGGEAFGVYQLEALAAGVPIVQPNVGAFPEVVAATGGGIIYEPNDGENLAIALSSLLAEPDTLCELGTRGRKTVLNTFTMSHMANNMVEIYERVTNNNK